MDKKQKIMALMGFLRERRMENKNYKSFLINYLQTREGVYTGVIVRLRKYDLYRRMKSGLNLRIRIKEL
jgi:hypothetical protein